MAKQTRTILKGYFETGKKPTGGNYVDLIDSHIILDSENTGSIDILGSITASKDLSVGGDITASGDISASGTIYADTFQSHGDTEIGLSDSLNITGNITASGTISASSYISASHFSGDGKGLTNITASTTNILSITASVATGSLVLSGSTTYTSGSTTVLLAIESTGSILPGENDAHDLGSPTHYWNDLYVSRSNVHTLIASQDISGVTGSFTGGVDSAGATGSFGYVSMSGDISSSGTGSFQGGIEADEATGSFGYISASGDISTSGTVFGDTGSFNIINDPDDTTTRIDFSFGDQVHHYVNNASYIRLRDTSEDFVSINDGGGDIDFKVLYEGSAEAIKTTAESTAIKISGSQITLAGPITASGDVSSSGTIHTDTLTSGKGTIAVTTILSGSSTGSFNHFYVSGEISGSVSASGTGSFVGGVEAPNATGSFGYISCSGDISASGTGSFLHLVVGEFNAKINTTSDISSSGQVSASGGFETDFSSSFGHVSCSGNLKVDGFASFGSFGNAQTMIATTTVPANFNSILYGPVTVGTNSIFDIKVDAQVKIKEFADA